MKICSQTTAHFLRALEELFVLVNGSQQHSNSCHISPSIATTVAGAGAGASIALILQPTLSLPSPVALLSRTSNVNIVPGPKRGVDALLSPQMLLPQLSPSPNSQFSPYTCRSPPLRPLLSLLRLPTRALRPTPPADAARRAVPPGFGVFADSSLDTAAGGDSAGTLVTPPTNPAGGILSTVAGAVAGAVTPKDGAGVPTTL